MSGLLRAVPYGAGALAVLREVLGELRGGDPLAPGDVAVPSSFTAVTVRRRLAAPGLVGVRFSALPRLIGDRAAGELAVAGRQPLTPARRRAAVRCVLAAGAGGLPEAARRSAGTAEVVAGIFAELDDAEAGDAVLAILADAGGWPAELSGLYRAYLEATAGAARPGEIADAACRAGGGTPLVIYLPCWLTAGELRFCRALAGRGLLGLVLGFTGDNDADAGAVAIHDALAPGVPLPGGTAAPAGDPQARPDAEEEVRYAVRRILAHLQANSPARPDRVGITYRAAFPMPAWPPSSCQPRGFRTTCHVSGRWRRAWPGGRFWACSRCPQMAGRGARSWTCCMTPPSGTGPGRCTPAAGGGWRAKPALPAALTSGLPGWRASPGGPGLTPARAGRSSGGAGIRRSLAGSVRRRRCGSHPHGGVVVELV